tara:strand:+ start:4139 stop:4549 length:411 start_codon:yes stop_codon:yes gene_type:complete
MEWFVILILAFVCLVFIFLANSGKNEASVNGKEITIDLTPYTWKETFELAGVHIPERRNYILQFVKWRHPVLIYHESNNRFSKQALAVQHTSVIIGYVPEYMITEVRPLLEKKHQVLIESVDFSGGYLEVKVSVYY